MDDGSGVAETKSTLSMVGDKMKNVDTTHDMGNPKEVVNVPLTPTQIQPGCDDPMVLAAKGPPADKVGLDGSDDGLTNTRKSFVDTVYSDKPPPKVNFRPLFNTEQVEDSDFVLPVKSVKMAHNRFANSLVGFFVGKRVAFQMVKNYVTNTWSKFGFQQIIKDDDDVYYFNFTSHTGLEQVLEKGPWMIRNQPLILTKWAPNLELKKDVVTKVPVWVKILKLPVVAYSEDGLSLIASQIGKPISLDAFTSAMCNEPWGRIGYARALIEVSADKDLKKEIKMAVPLLDHEGKVQGHAKDKLIVEYEWTPPRCTECKVFGHTNMVCSNRIVEQVPIPAVEANDGFTTVQYKRKKGKKTATDQNKHIEGLKLSKPSPKFAYVWSAKPNHQTNKKPNDKDGDAIIKTNNSFSVLNDDNPIFSSKEIPETSSKHVRFDSESEVEEMENEFSSNTEFKGASTPSDDALNV